MPLNWDRFVLAYGGALSARELAGIVGQPEAAIARVRAAGAGQGAAKLAWAEVFARWHGRDPVESDWPAPRRAGPIGDGSGQAYTWSPPEDALLATLVGTIGTDEIAAVLTKRLRKVTGDRRALRTRNSVSIRMQRVGLITGDVVGGITVPAAGVEIGSVYVVRQAIGNGSLHAHRVGKRLVIPHREWTRWKSSRLLPPKGYMALAKIRERLGIRSDKLSEFARMGYVPTAIRCRPAERGQHSTKFGTWYIDRKVARKLIADRRAGRPMPWHGKPEPGNLKITFRLWETRKHPPACATCRDIWGGTPPRTFEEYSRRYPPLAHGAKRHLTRPWTTGLTVADVMRQAKVVQFRVQRAIKNGCLRAEGKGRALRITRTDATRWIARRCPTGTSEKSWITLKLAKHWYGFSAAEIRAFVAAGKLKDRIGTAGAARGVYYVNRQQVTELRDRIGFTEAQAAKRIGVTVANLRTLLKGVQWRRAPRIPLVTVQAVGKRLQSQNGYTIEQAAKACGKPAAWVRERIHDGTVRVTRTPWDDRRLYITAPMLERLKKAKRAKPRRRLSNAWLGLTEAAEFAGISTATIRNWAVAGDLRTQHATTGIHYSRRSVLARARRYWKSPKYKRAVPPAHLAPRATGEQKP